MSRMDNTPRPDEFIGASDVAATLGIVRQTVYRWIELGRITPVGHIAGRQVFLRREIEAYRDQLQDGAA